MESSSELLTRNGRPPVRRGRVVTEARKEQNRVAQRAYRRRQREERLKQPRPQPAYRFPVLQPLPTAQVPPSHDGIPPASASSLSSRDPASSFASDIERDNLEFLGRIQDTAPETVGPSSLADLHVQPSGDPLNIVAIDPLVPIDFVLEGENSLSDQPLPTEGIAGSDIDLNHPAEDDGGHGVTQPAFADLYLNRLQPSKMALLHACFFNARCLGIGAKEFSSYSCLSLCSPFYRPVTMSEDPKALLAAVSRPSIPPHLQPTLPQVLFPHHPILDLLPLPGLRARAIVLAATAPFLLDAFDFKKDVVEGGLICWAAQRGGSSQPWDRRSWEAVPWFLQKWRLLVDGPQSELWQQSAWWQGMRGEVSAR
ncbi:hypothetical protein N8T08_008760 [Aspergillus melleus]|uniref:Uncharacterized protein n=1 Tax=Aspergillus melleus TaxID=138277 RepID=A0ACC3BDR3_9EURO|nr:hypothetical protein N8T08_008760 [Aspergillus melleus]